MTHDVGRAPLEAALGCRPSRVVRCRTGTGWGNSRHVTSFLGILSVGGERMNERRAIELRTRRRRVDEFRMIPFGTLPMPVLSVLHFYPRRSEHEKGEA